MANWKITISGKNIRKETVEKLANNLKDKFGDNTSIHVTDNTPPESRQARLSQALGQVEDAMSEVESLKEELQEWYDNLPEAFQNGEKGEQLQTAIDALEEITNQLEDVSGKDGDVEFPGMY